VAPPDPRALRGQLLIDHEAARLHLRQVVNHYDDSGWRREHKGFGVYPPGHDRQRSRPRAWRDFDLTNKLMRVVQHAVSQVLFWSVIVLIYEVMEHGARMRRLRAHVS
jgi:hypothetical protein